MSYKGSDISVSPNELKFRQRDGRSPIIHNIYPNVLKLDGNINRYRIWGDNLTDNMDVFIDGTSITGRVVNYTSPRIVDIEFDTTTPSTIPATMNVVVRNHSGITSRSMPVSAVTDWFDLSVNGPSATVGLGMGYDICVGTYHTFTRNSTGASVGATATWYGAVLLKMMEFPYESDFRIEMVVSSRPNYMRLGIAHADVNISSPAFYAQQIIACAISSTYAYPINGRNYNHEYANTVGVGGFSASGIYKIRFNAQPSAKGNVEIYQINGTTAGFWDDLSTPKYISNPLYQYAYNLLLERSPVMAPCINVANTPVQVHAIKISGI